MKVHRVEGRTLIVPAGQSVGLSAKQYQRRKHVVGKVREASNIFVCVFAEDVQFKVGETDLLLSVFFKVAAIRNFTCVRSRRRGGSMAVHPWGRCAPFVTLLLLRV